MLPDFPVLKSEIKKILFAKLQRRVDTGDPVLAEVRRFTQHEGLEMFYEQHGGGGVRQGFEEIGAKFEIRIEDVPDLLGAKLDAKLQEIAQALTSESAKMFFKKIGESCQQAGTSIDAGGKPMSAEMILEMLSRVQIEFGPDGKPTSSFVIHPDMAPGVMKIAEEFENSPDLKRRHSEILERQREAWTARESNRKLVD